MKALSTAYTAKLLHRKPKVDEKVFDKSYLVYAYISRVYLSRRSLTLKLAVSSRDVEQKQTESICYLNVLNQGPDESRYDMLVLFMKFGIHVYICSLIHYCCNKF